MGHFQVLDTTSVTPSSMMLYQVNTQGGVVLSFDISSNCQNMAFGDSSGTLTLYICYICIAFVKSFKNYYWAYFDQVMIA